MPPSPLPPRARMRTRAAATRASRCTPPLSTLLTAHADPLASRMTPAGLLSRTSQHAPLSRLYRRHGCGRAAVRRWRGRRVERLLRTTCRRGEALPCPTHRHTARLGPATTRSSVPWRSGEAGPARRVQGMHGRRPPAAGHAVTRTSSRRPWPAGDSGSVLQADGRMTGGAGCAGRGCLVRPRSSRPGRLLGRPWHGLAGSWLRSPARTTAEARGERLQGLRGCWPCDAQSRETRSSDITLVRTAMNVRPPRSQRQLVGASSWWGMALRGPDRPCRCRARPHPADPVGPCGDPVGPCGPDWRRSKGSEQRAMQRRGMERGGAGKCAMRPGPAGRAERTDGSDPPPRLASTR
jgi:hypothetical protein